MLALCTSNVTGGPFPADPPVFCKPYQTLETMSPGDDSTAFPSFAACLERRDLIREQANAFVLNAECYNAIQAPKVRWK